MKQKVKQFLKRAKPPINDFIAWIVFVLIIYGFFSFGQWELDARKWTIAIRWWFNVPVMGFALFLYLSEGE